MDGSVFRVDTARTARNQGRLYAAALALGLALLFFMQLWAGLGLRGLYADGSYYAARLWLAQGFVVIEPARWTAQTIMQLPSVLAMRLGAPSAIVVARIFSVTTNLMPLGWTLLGAAILPRGLRVYALPSILTFLGAGMSAAVASVADAPLATAYLWLLFLLIAVAPLSRARLATMLVLAAGALRLHEATALLGPTLILACLWRLKKAPTTGRRLILALCAGLLTLGTIRAGLDLLHPRLIANRASFLHDFTSFHWLWSADGSLNIAIIAGLAAGLAFLAFATAGRRARWPLGAACAVWGMLTVLAVILPPAPPAAFAARGLSCLVSAPVMLFVLGARMGMKWPIVPTRAAIACTAALSLTLATADARTNLAWGDYVSAMRGALADEHGVIPWADAAAAEPRGTALRRFAWPWTAPLMSLWLAPQDKPLRSLIANPPGQVWEPLSPAVQWKLLAIQPPSYPAEALSAIAQ